MTDTIFVATPSHDGRVHVQWAAGALQMMVAFPGRIRIETQQGSFLPRNRDILTKKFLDSGATHFLCVDSDLAWGPDAVNALLAADRDFISGIYCKKTADRGLPFRFTEEREGQLQACEHAPGGFLLIKRAVIERMVGAYRNLQYKTGDAGHVWALWSPLFEQGRSYDGEDVAFCRRWRDLGGKIWAHHGVVLAHFGEHAYLPNDDRHVPQDR